ncbi:MAG TPA: AraC family transcriptional regulator, partial [Chitinophagales bacterium]|nr:AraC family transcriptional regulator [Chitinophagales bacterium]
MKLYVKYMVSIRCKMLVKTELEALHLHYRSIELGEIDVVDDITEEQRSKLKIALALSGLALMDDKKAIL